MKRTLILFIALLTLTGISAKGKRELVILHTNDTHSCIYPLSANLADTLLAGRGGFLRRLAMINEERQKCPDLLLIDSGDFSQGSPYYTLFKGDVEAGLMNRMGYDAGTIGNHEFDCGLDNMARVFGELNFPVVCANYDFSGTPVEGLVKPYITLKRNGIKIGLFGLSPELDGLVATENYQGVTFLDPIAKANEMAAILREKEKCDVVICISHLGWNTDPAYVGDNQVIAASHGIDIFLGGHSHTYLEKLEYINDADGKPVAVDQNGKHAIFVGKLIVDFEKK
ncbi:MAG: bifunctional metallophosphatase/5'-nucleotidase [Prevotella sp.]|nr:bifunctional metallophosphatase/5'-nucleotidase [Prevotella sp.]